MNPAHHIVEFILGVRGTTSPVHHIKDLERQLVRVSRVRGFRFLVGYDRYIRVRADPGSRVSNRSKKLLRKNLLLLRGLSALDSGLVSA